MQRMQANKGFTVAELMTALVLTALVLIVLFTSLNTIARDVGQQRERSELGADLQVATDILEREVRYSMEFTASLPSGYNDWFAMSNTRQGTAQPWSVNGGGAGDRVLLTSSDSTSSNPLSSERQNVYLVGTDPYDCNTTSERLLKTRLRYSTVYFLKNNQLYRRVITHNPSTIPALCTQSSEWQMHTCPTLADVANYVECDARDEVLATDVESFDVRYFYFDNSGASPVPTTIDVYGASDRAAAIAGADGADITIRLERVQSGQTLSHEKTIRVVRLN